MALQDSEKKIINNEFSKFINSNDYDNFIIYWFNFYNSYVKQNETADHHQDCYMEIEKYLVKYGNYLKKRVKHANVKNNLTGNINICYFFPTLANDLAHVQLFYNLFNHHPKNSHLKIYVAGFLNLKSKLLIKLLNEKKIEIIAIPLNNESIISFILFLIENDFKQLIFVSIPVLITAFSIALGIEKVTWQALKFELNCFSYVKNKISYQLNQLENLSSSNEWYRSEAKLDLHLKYKYTPKNNSVIKFISINRPEKIRDEKFLCAILNILTKVENSHFYWTGKTQDRSINDFFISNKIIQRTSFIGWVNPAEIINSYDIFLDTPLSGIVAANCFAAGMPIVTFKNSFSWIEFYEKSFLENYPDLYNKSYISHDLNTYIDCAVKLAGSFSYRVKYSKVQKILGDLFFDTSKMYQDHISIIKKIISRD